MKYLLSTLLLVFSFVLVQAQENDRRAFLSEEDFVPPCIQGAQAQMGASAQTYCSCVYEQLINELTDQEFEKMYALISKGKSSFVELPAVKKVISACLEQTIKTDNENKTPDEDNKLKAIYIKSCSEEAKKNKTLKKMIDANEYCECTWYKILNGVGVDKLISNQKSKEVSDAIVQYATECIGEQFK